MQIELSRWRGDTPGVSRRVHLNNAGASLMPQPVITAVQEHLWLEADIGGYEAEAEVASRLTEAYGHLARLVGAEPRNIAIVENATVALSQALSVFDFRSGDRVVTTRSDYPSNQLMYLSLAQRCGVEVVRAADLPAGGVDPESVRAHLHRGRCRVVVVSWIPTNSGLIQPVEEVGEVCEEAGVPFVIDACQAVGQVPIDGQALRCDYLAATARKFLRGPRGIGFLYVSDRALQRGDAPLFIDLHSARWVDPDRYELSPSARRFENGEFAYSLVLGLGEAARYAMDVGVAPGGARAAELAAYARGRLEHLPGVRVLDHGRRLCAIATAEIRGWNAGDTVRWLRRRGVNTSASHREDGVIDMDQKGAASALRISPHYFNTHEELDRAIEAIAEMLLATS